MPEAGPPAAGERAPVLDLPDTHGTPVRLGGARPVPQLVVFLPFAFTLTCSGELRDLDEAVAGLTPASVVAVTCDAGPSLRAWAAHEQVGLTLVSDFWPHGRAATAFGVLDAVSGYATRSTFLLDDDGVVAWSVHHPAGQARSVADYRGAVARLAR